mgnify:FL=1
MKEFLKKNYKYIIVIFSISAVMTFFMTKKEGFHEDEMFSYGSSNYAYDNVYRPYGKEDETNIFVKEKIMNDNIIQNLKYYLIDHRDVKDETLASIKSEFVPTWRSSDEANDYLTIQPKDALNYGMVYYNQSRDIHPPLFYFLVHTVSIFFMGHFSKYIIFSINLVFMILSLWTIKNIFEKLDKKHLIVPALILYGFSMGAISTVIFQRMYSMLNFFVLMFISANIDIIKKDFDIDKKLWNKLTWIVLLGFWTQYYFCIVAGVVAVLVLIGVIRKQGKQGAITYILKYLKMAVIGVLLYPLSINHIFFSYRGVGKAEMARGFGEKLVEYLNMIGYSFSVPVLAIAICLILLVMAVAVKSVIDKKVDKKALSAGAIIFSVICYVCVIVKVSPELQDANIIRYIMCVLPLIIISILLLIDTVIKNKNVLKYSLVGISLVISVYGLMFSEPAFLYKGYAKYLEIAEENKEDKFVYVGDTVFNHIQSMPEFATYSESLILNENQLDVLENDSKLSEENEFILSIKKYKDADEILAKVIEKTGFSNYEVLLDDDGDVGCKIYKVMR